MKRGLFTPRCWAVVLATVAAGIASPVNALCSYNGNLYAQTTLSQEFADSDWVVRARVTRERVYEKCSDCPGRLYTLELIHSFKGDAPETFAYYTPQNSGGFYLNQGKEAIGSEWLLFLDRPDWVSEWPEAAKGATVINYSCGQSREWNTIDAASRADLIELENAK